VPFKLVYAGKYSTEEKSKTKTKDNPEKANTKTQQNKTTVV